MLTFLTDPEAPCVPTTARGEAVAAARQMEADSMQYTARDSGGQVLQAATAEELAARAAAAGSEYTSWTVRVADSEAPGGSRYVGYINGGVLVSVEQMDAEAAEAETADQDTLDDEMFGPPDADPEWATPDYDPAARYSWAVTPDGRTGGPFTREMAARVMSQPVDGPDDRRIAESAEAAGIADRMHPANLAYLRGEMTYDEHQAATAGDRAAALAATLAPGAHDAEVAQMRTSLNELHQGYLRGEVTEDELEQATATYNAEIGRLGAGKPKDPAYIPVRPSADPAIQPARENCAHCAGRTAAEPRDAGRGMSGFVST